MMKLAAAKKLFSFIKAFLTFLLFLLTSAFAPTQTHAFIILTELHPNPSDGPEWVELYNTSDELQSLEGWKLEDQLSSPSTLVTFSDLDSIAPKTSFVYELSSNKLNNLADGVTLFDNLGEIADITSYTESAEKNMSWSRGLEQGSDWSFAAPTKGEYTPMPSPTPTPSPLPSDTPSPTPTPTTLPSLSPSPTPSPTSSVQPSTPSPSPIPIAIIRIQEIDACPSAGNNEGIKLLNLSTFGQSLDGWYILDNTGNRRTLSGVISANGIFSHHWSGSILNNSGDSVHLYTNTDTLMDSANYDSCITGSVLTKTNGVWSSGTLLPSPSPSPSFITQTNTENKQHSEEFVIAGTILGTSATKLHYKLPTLDKDSQIQQKNSNKFIAYVQRPVPRAAIFSVILGGVLMTLGASLLLWIETKQNETQRKTVTFFLK